MARRPRARKFRPAGTSEIVTLVLLIGMLAFVFIFKDSMASGISAVMSTFDTPTPEIAPPTLDSLDDTPGQPQTHADAGLDPATAEHERDATTGSNP